METETEKMVLKLIGDTRRWERGENPHKRYQFIVLESEAIPLQEEELTSEITEVNYVM